MMREARPTPQRAFLLAACWVLLPYSFPCLAAESASPERAAYIAELRKLYDGPPQTWPAPQVDPEVSWVELGLLPKVVDPPENPSSEAKVALGHQLFFDPRLSGSGQLACASCHEPDLSWSDGRAVAVGHNRTPLKRNAPSVLNSGLRSSLFWDGRADGLEAQAVAVLSNQDEMHSSEEILIENLSQIPEYTQQFEAVFGDPQPTLERVTHALAAYQRTLVGGHSRFDRFLKGYPRLLTNEEVAGLHVFRTKGRCMNCHHGPLLTDEKFHSLGLSNYGTRFEDLGRFHVTEDQADAGAFRTPSLRNVARTAPYMHSGMFTLNELLTLYNAGMLSHGKKWERDSKFPRTSTLLKPLQLTDQELSDLKAFLGSLNEPHLRIEPPKLPAFSSTP